MKFVLVSLPALLLAFLFWNHQESPAGPARTAAGPASAPDRAGRRIVDARTEQPLAGARFHALRLGERNVSEWDRTGETGIDGRFDLEGTGPWLVHVRCAGFAPVTGALDGIIRMVPLSSIRGRVVDENDHPIAGAPVYFRFPMELRIDNPALPDELLAIRDRLISEPAAQATSDPYGLAAIVERPGLPALRLETDGAGFFQVDHLLPDLGYAARIAPAGWCAMATLPIVPNAGETVKITIRLRRSGTITGRTLKPDGTPAPGAVVTIYGHTADGGMMNEAVVAAGADGSFTATLSPGEKWMETSFRNDGTDWYGGMTCETGRDWILELGRGGVVVGCVADPDNRPVAGARVWLIARRPDEARSVETVTSKEGRFEVRGLVGDSLEYSVTPPDPLKPIKGIVAGIPAQLPLRLECK